MKQPLKGKVAVVAGATRGTGRGIACELGAAGAIVYCTGRSTRENRIASENQEKKKKKNKDAFVLSKRPETIEETAEMITARGGVGIAVQADHMQPEQVKNLFARVEKEQGQLDILVNDIWGGDELTEWKPLWESSVEKGLMMLERAISTHIITTHFAAPLLIKTKKGLIVEITDGDHFGYRGSFFYDFVKTSVIRLAFLYSMELKKHKITSLALTPGFIRSEAMLDYFGVTEANWQDAAKQFPSFIESETPFYSGRAVVALAADKKVFKRTGKVFAAWDLGEEYNLTDVDGRKPNMREWLQKNMPDWEWKTCDDTFYEYWGLK